MEVLNDRQKQIMAFLADGNGPTTARLIADTFKVSLRTIRYDMEDITSWLKDCGLELIKKPKVGFEISDKSQLKKILCNLDITPSEVYSLDERKNIILLLILFSQEEVFSYDISEKLGISKTTVINIIKSLRDDLEYFGISIKGKTRSGYFADGDEVLIRKYILYELFPLLKRDFQDLFHFLDKLIHPEIIQKAYQIEKEVSHLIKFNHSANKEDFLRFAILMLICRISKGTFIKNKPSYHRYCKETGIFQSIQQIILRFVDVKEREDLYNEVVYAIYFLLKEGYDRTVLKYVKPDENQINEIVSKLLFNVSAYIDLPETETLQRELFEHFKSTFCKTEFGIKDRNPILDEVKTKYGDIFYIIEKTSHPIFQDHKLTISEDEIGFITLYFVKAVEQPLSNKNKKILLVCDLGRSTTSFLKTRLMNNLKDVEIFDSKTAIDKRSDKELISNIDLIVSTYNIEEVGIPTLIVSPMIRSQEFTQIRELLYLPNPAEIRKRIELRDFKESLSEILDKNSSLSKDPRMNIEIMNFFSFYSERYFNNMDFLDQEVEMISMILLEVLEMVTKLVDIQQTGNYLKIVTGIFIHIVIAVPRWQRGEFIYENNYHFFKYKYPEEVNIIEETISKINRKYNLDIKNTEAISILRYILDNN